jgi:hypothetical protein
LAPAFRKGEAVRLTTGGVPVREGGLLGRLIEGLSQEEKKSSSASPAGVFDPSEGVPAGRSVMMTSSGYLNKATTLVNTESWEFHRHIWIHSLLRIERSALLEFLLILDGCIARILDFGVLACERSGTSVRLEVLSRGLVSTDLHHPQLFPLPFFVYVSLDLPARMENRGIVS